MSTPPDALLTARETARILRVEPTTVYRWIRTGRLRARRTPGGRPRIHPDDVAALRPSGGGK